MENSYNTSKDSGIRTISHNNKIKIHFSPSPNLFKTEIYKKDFAFDGFNSFKNNKYKFDKFGVDDSGSGFASARNLK